MKTVLVPIDGSPGALRALDHAVAELRDRPQARIHLLLVQSPPVHAWPDKLVSPDMIADELRREGQTLLGPARATVQAAGIGCDSHVRIGAPAEEIAGCAVEQGCDAIVMGTRGMGAAAGLLLGSVATKVVHTVAVPVTLVK